jgi:hypothetical protein
MPSVDARKPALASGAVACVQVDKVIVAVTGAARLIATPGGVEIDVIGGRSQIGIAIGPWRRQGRLLRQAITGATGSGPLGCAESWKRRWGDAFIRLPDDRLQALWARSLWYQLASSTDGGQDGLEAPPPPMGLTSLCWQRHFPQDISFIHPALLRSGHIAIVRGWVERYRIDLESQEAITKSAFRVLADGGLAQGAHWSWEYPIGPESQQLQHGAPNWFQFQAHNAAYPSRMAWDCWRFLNDAAWGAAIAWPVIRASARFHASILRRGPDGLWGIHIAPSFGQEEFGGMNAPDYLCSLYAARSTLKTALAAAARLGVDDAECAQWRGILSDGLAFERLRHAPSGLLTTNRVVVDGSALGLQKHPIQLHPLVYTPTEGAIDPDSALAFERRASLTARWNEHGEAPIHSIGWTLPAYWVAAVRLGQGEALHRMLEPVQFAGMSGASDAEGITMLESTGETDTYYFTTSHGLYQQAVQDAFIDDTFGILRRHQSIPAAWRGARYANLRTADGNRHSGTV